MSETEEAWKRIVPEYETPYTYKIIETEIISKLADSVKKSVNGYLDAKTSLLKNIEIQGILDLTWINDEQYVFENATRLRNALHMKNLGDKSTPEIVPILYYYSAEQLMNFFVYSLVKVPMPKNTHGISVSPNKEIENTVITIKPTGFFARIVDVYSMLNNYSIFSPIELKYEKGATRGTFVVNEHSFALTDEKEFTLLELINQKSTNITSLDLRNLILIYAGSHFSRYSPYLWKQVVDGIKTGLITNFRKAYSEYHYMIIKHIQALESLRKGYYGHELAQPNIPQIRNSFGWGAF